MLTITLQQDNAVDFDLALTGDVGSSVCVVMTIKCEAVSYRFDAHQMQGTAWQVQIPAAVAIPAGEYEFAIDVYVDNHVYPAMNDRVAVKAPFKPVASIKSAAPAASPVATATIKESRRMPAVKAGSIRQIHRE